MKLSFVGQIMRRSRWSAQAPDAADAAISNYNGNLLAEQVRSRRLPHYMLLVPVYCSNTRSSSSTKPSFMQDLTAPPHQQGYEEPPPLPPDDPPPLPPPEETSQPPSFPPGYGAWETANSYQASGQEAAFQDHRHWQLGNQANISSSSMFPSLIGPMPHN